MPRASRYFTAERYSHITRRCHDRSLLLEFAMDPESLSVHVARTRSGPRDFCSGVLPELKPCSPACGHCPEQGHWTPLARFGWRLGSCGDITKRGVDSQCRVDRESGGGTRRMRRVNAAVNQEPVKARDQRGGWGLVRKESGLVYAWNGFPDPKTGPKPAIRPCDGRNRLSRSK